jgi:transcriptional regulator with XRE-family HTH domain
MESCAVLGYSRIMMTLVHPQPIGGLLREWRSRRRMSQLDLAFEADISPRHLSFVETGRSQPSREMVLHLAEQLEVPLRERNVLLVAAGYAPMFPERPLEDPALQAAKRVVEMVLKGHEPYPALAIDRHWTLVAANGALAPLMAGIAPTLTEPPVNVLRVALHPDGLAPRIANLVECRSHLLGRLRRQIEITGDPVLQNLLQEIDAYPAPRETQKTPEHDYSGVAVPMRISTEAGELSFISTTTVFGSPVDITLSELAVEAFFPADTATAERMRSLARK